MGGFVYEDTALKFFASPEGRIVKNGSGFEYQYAIADHQGNTRVVFTGNTPEEYDPLATFEGDANDESDEYDYAGAIVTFPSANHTPGGSKVVQTNQTNNVGTAKSLKVYPGDVVDAEVWAYYESGSGYGTSSPLVSVIMGAVSAAFGGVMGGGESGLIYSGVNNAFGAYGLAGNQGDNVPAAYLNYILFDKNYKLLDMGWKPVTSASSWAKAKISFDEPIAVKEEGYLFVYLSYENQSNNPVYFDDMKVTHSKSNVIQYNEYYPFGLQASTSWTRENTHQNAYLYNEGNELNSNTGWYEMFFRGYDPALGRMLQVDPFASDFMSLSPYNYVGNNPVLLTDPSGGSTPELRELTALLNQTDFSYQIPGGGFGFKGPGSASHWSNGHNRSGWSFSGGSASYMAEFAYTNSYGGFEVGGSFYSLDGNPLNFENGRMYEWNSVGGDFAYSKEYEKDGKTYRNDYYYGAWVQAKSVILDLNGNIKSWEKGANSIFVDMGDGSLLGFGDRLLIGNKMSKAAFSNGLLSIVNGMNLPKGKFDRNKLHKGEISLAVPGPEGIITYNDGQYTNEAANFIRRDGFLQVTYSHLGGMFLTVDIVQKILGVHEYYAHGVRGLIHNRDNNEINTLVAGYPY